jgi:hypothetical protein
MTGARVAAAVGIVAHVATVFLYLASGLVAPLAGILFLFAGWALLLYGAVRLRTTRQWLVLATPVASIAFWAGVLTFGDWVLGWTA